MDSSTGTQIKRAAKVDSGSKGDDFSGIQRLLNSPGVIGNPIAPDIEISYVKHGSKSHFRMIAADVHADIGHI